jgi:hypothetical protein
MTGYLVTFGSKIILAIRLKRGLQEWFGCHG